MNGNVNDTYTPCTDQFKGDMTTSEQLLVSGRYVASLPKMMGGYTVVYSGLIKRNNAIAVIAAAIALVMLFMKLYVIASVMGVAALAVAVYIIIRKASLKRQSVEAYDKYKDAELEYLFFESFVQFKATRNDETLEEIRIPYLGLSRFGETAHVIYFVCNGMPYFIYKEDCSDSFLAVIKRISYNLVVEKKEYDKEFKGIVIVSAVTVVYTLLVCLSVSDKMNSGEMDSPAFAVIALPMILGCVVYGIICMVRKKLYGLYAVITAVLCISFSLYFVYPHLDSLSERPVDSGFANWSDNTAYEFEDMTGIDIPSDIEVYGKEYVGGTTIYTDDHTVMREYMIFFVDGKYSAAFLESVLADPRWADYDEVYNGKYGNVLPFVLLDGKENNSYHLYFDILTGIVNGYWDDGKPRRLLYVAYFPDEGCLHVVEYTINTRMLLPENGV